MQTRSPLLIEDPEIWAPPKDSVEQSEVLTLLGVNQEQWHAAQVAYDCLVSLSRLEIDTLRVDMGQHRRHIKIIQLIKNGGGRFIDFLYR